MGNLVEVGEGFEEKDFVGARLGYGCEFDPIGKVKAGFFAEFTDHGF